MLAKSDFEWKKITSDKTVLDALKGYRLTFHTLPPVRNYSNNPTFSDEEKKSIDLEVTKFLRKGIIEKTFASNSQFVTHIFTRFKKDGSQRVILNLKSLNEFIENYHFKMDSVKTAINLMSNNCFFGSIDLKDAFFSIPVKECDRIFLRFC